MYFYYQTCFMILTNLRLIQYLSDGFTVSEISEETGVNRRTIEKRILILKRATMSKNSIHLVANYLRKQLIN